MRKVLSIALVFAMIVSFAACGGTTGGSTPTEDPGGSAEMETAAPAPTPTPTPTQKPDETAYEITYAHTRTYKNNIGSVWAQTIIEIENTGATALFLSSGAFDLEDASGTLVKSSTLVSVYPDVIAPGEKAYYYDETTLDDLEDAIELEVLPRPKVDKAKVELIRYSVSDISLSNDDYSGVKMLGRVENTSGEAESMVYVAAILFNSADEPIGQVFTIIMEEFAPGDKIGFEMSGFSLPDDVTAESVVRYEVFAYPLQMQF